VRFAPDARIADINALLDNYQVLDHRRRQWLCSPANSQQGDDRMKFVGLLGKLHTRRSLVSRNRRLKGRFLLEPGSHSGRPSIRG